MAVGRDQVPGTVVPNSCWASRLTSVKGSLRINMVPTSCGLDVRVNARYRLF
jgi:hypothetical protein